MQEVWQKQGRTNNLVSQALKNLSIKDKIQGLDGKWKKQGQKTVIVTQALEAMALEVRKFAIEPSQENRFNLLNSTNVLAKSCYRGHMFVYFTFPMSLLQTSLLAGQKLEQRTKDNFEREMCQYNESKTDFGCFRMGI